MSSREPRHYGWVIFALSFINLMVEGAVKNTVPVVYVALRDSFNWSAAATSGIFSLAGLGGGAECAATRPAVRSVGGEVGIPARRIAYFARLGLQQFCHRFVAVVIFLQRGGHDW